MVKDVYFHVINPDPYLKESEVDIKLRKYYNDPNECLTVDRRAKAIKSNLKKQLNQISLQLALFNVAVLKSEVGSEKVYVVSPSTITQAQ